MPFHRRARNRFPRAARSGYVPGMDSIVIIAALIALALGAVIGWLLGNRAAAAGKQAAESLRLQLDGVVAERDAARSAAEASRDEAGRAKEQLAALAADARNHEKQIATLMEAKEALSAQFSEVGSKILGEAQKAFLERADQRFEQANEKGGERLAKLLEPVNQRLKSYEEQVGKVERERTEAYGSLKSLIGEMKQGQERVSTEAARLVNSLRNAPKARGRWGEQQLKNVLESCGLSEHVDFVTESSVETEEGRLRPDAIVRIPGGKSLVIDAKVSLNAYQDAFEADDDIGKRAALSAHCASMKAHVNALGNKSYQSQFDDAPDYVIMFVPGEHFLSAALEHDPHLWDFAFDKKVLLATPTNLVAIARTVSSVWRQEGLAREAQLIGQLGKEMYDRLATAAEHLKRMGSGLSSAVGNYNKFVGSFERNVLSTGRRFKELNVDTGKRELEEISELDALPRYGDTIPEPGVEAAK